MNKIQDTVKIAKARLSFNSLFETELYNGEDTGKYSATLILDKNLHSNEIETLKGQIEYMIRELEVKKLDDDKICLKNPSDTMLKVPEYLEGCLTIKATTKKKPMLLKKEHGELIVVQESDNLFYSGCYVNAIIRLWLQNNKYGKRINCSLEGLMFASDGDVLAKTIDKNEFSSFEDSVEDLPF
jgi:hypothetical protein